MTAILGYTDLLITENWGRPVNLERLAVVRRNADHLLTLLNDVLDLSKIEAGKMRVERIAVSPAQFLADVAELQRPRASGKGLTLDVAYETPIPQTIQTDPTRVRQVLINLVGNAIKFTERGGVRLFASIVRDGGGGGVSSLLRVKVTDTGIGMDDQQLQAIFHAFRQADTSTTRRFGGTGLGLTISRRLARLLGGDIEVTSKPGQGSTFSVTFDTGPIEGVPMTDAFAPPGAARTQRPTGPPAGDRPLEGVRVLLAEDGPDNQQLIRTILGRKGADVTVVENGLEACRHAVEAAEAGRAFDVVFMDMQMPVLDGYGATRRLRERGYRGPIIALTAHTMASDRDKCLEAGCDDYASKPIDFKALVALAEKHAGRTDAQNETGGRGSHRDDEQPESPFDATGSPLPVESKDTGGGLPVASAPDSDAPIVTAGQVMTQRIVGPFADRLPDRLRLIEEALRQNDLSALRHAAARLGADVPPDHHPRLMELTTQVQRRLLGAQQLDQVRREVEELIQTCWRAVGTRE
jgi:CheY-like chemotaxis protein